MSLQFNKCHVYDSQHMGSEVSLLHPWGAAVISHIWEKLQVISSDGNQVTTRKVYSWVESRCKIGKWSKAWHLCARNFPTWHLMPQGLSKHIFPTLKYEKNNSCKLKITNNKAVRTWSQLCLCACEGADRRGELESWLNVNHWWITRNDNISRCSVHTHCSLIKLWLIQ